MDEPVLASSLDARFLTGILLEDDDIAGGGTDDGMVLEKADGEKLEPERPAFAMEVADLDLDSASGGLGLLGL